MYFDRIRQIAIIMVAALSCHSIVAIADDSPADLSVATDHENRMDPRAPEQLKDLSFLIGSWNLTTNFVAKNGVSYPSVGRMTGRYAMGGFAIETTSIHPKLDDANGIFVDSHLYSIHPEKGRIVGVTVNTLGNRKNHEGEFTNGELRLVTTGEMFGGGDFINRSIIFDITDSSFKTRLEISVDDGVTWHDAGYTAEATKSQ